MMSIKEEVKEKEKHTNTKREKETLVEPTESKQK